MEKEGANDKGLRERDSPRCAAADYQRLSPGQTGP
jgi:hypothetical protein